MRLTQTVVPGAIHDVTNAHDSPAVSIHAYSPRLTQMTYYSQVSGQLSPARTVLTRGPEAV